MALNIEQLREVIIRPALLPLKLHCKDSEELLVMTMAHESKGGTFVKQVEGPALGVYQMEPFTYDDLWRNFLSQKKEIAISMLNALNFIQKPSSEHLTWNLKLATMMARVYYLRVREALPDSSDVNAMAEYCKKYWNTSKGKASVQDYVNAYRSFVGKKAEGQRNGGKTTD